MKLSEITAIQRYYQQNPQRLQHLGISGPAKSEYEVPREKSAQLSRKLKNLEAALAERWKSMANLKINGRPLLSFGWDNKSFEIDYWARYDIEKARTFDELLKRTDIEIDDSESAAQLRDVYPRIRADYIKLKKAKEAAATYASSLHSKMSVRSGVSEKDYVAAMEWIKHYTSHSGKKIPKEIYDTLQKLTVNPRELPRYVYRGMFFDGAKINDRDKFLKKWYPGSRPGMRFTKASSWSSSIGVATQFMDAQDKVKDQKNGFALLLRKEITDPKQVIADLRNLPTATFWNQQEILLDPGVNDYEVFHMLPYEDYRAAGKTWQESDLARFQAQHKAPAAGGFGFSQREMLLQFYFQLPELQISSSVKERWRTYTKLTAAAVKKQEGILGKYNEEFESKLEDLLFPLYLAATSIIDIFEVQPVEPVNKNSLSVQINASLPERTKNSTNALIPLIKQVTGLEEWTSTEMGYFNRIRMDAILTQTSTDANRIDFAFSNISNMRISGSYDALPKEKIVLQIQDLLQNSTQVQQSLISLFKKSLETQNSKGTTAKFKVV